jgi:hypothetical protein
VNRKLGAWLILAAVFLSGVGLGAAAMRIHLFRQVRAFYEGPPETREEKLALIAFHNRVHTDEAQERAIAEIIQKHRPDVAAVRRTIYAPLARIRDEEYDAIRALLGPEQLPAYEALIAQWKLAAKRVAGLEGDQR